MRLSLIILALLGAAFALPIQKNEPLKKAYIAIQQDTTAKQLDSNIVEKKYKMLKGTASFYSANLDGTKTSTGETFRNKKFTAASNNFKLNTWVKVTRLSNGKSVVVRINDRMHKKMAKKGRVVDLSRAAAAELGMLKAGLTKVMVEEIEKPI
jgi:rare lipoprotein A